LSKSNKNPYYFFLGDTYYVNNKVLHKLRESRSSSMIECTAMWLWIVFFYVFFYFLVENFGGGQERGKWLIGLMEEFVLVIVIEGNN
jgi:hypothetical protein